MKTVAVIGASNDRSKFGNKAVRAFQAEGYRVVPVNLTERTVEGLPAYRSILDVPDPVDMVTVYVPPEATLQVLGELARRPVGEIWINPGADDDAVMTEARRLGLKPIFACSIVGMGRSPSQF
jgi:predicted CoA-binding protein